MMLPIGYLGEVNVDPLGDMMLDFLIERDKEETFLDFKETMSVAKGAPFAKIAKDIFAFANYGGGFILLGFRERQKSKQDTQEQMTERSFVPIGLPDDFHIDPADLQTKFNSYSSLPIELQYREFYRDIGGTRRKFAAIYIPPSTGLLKAVRSGLYTVEGKERKAFPILSILFRRGTQSVPASDEEKAWIKKRAERDGYRISVISGCPDEIPETLYGNLFDVLTPPEFLWIVQKEDTRLIPRNVVFRHWSNQLVMFSDPTQIDNFLSPADPTNHVRREKVEDWLCDDDRRRVIINLLNKELRFLGDRLGLFHEPHREKFYFPCYEGSRTVTWTTRLGRRSNPIVAREVWDERLGHSAFFHLAVIARFVCDDGKLFLQLTPTIQLTEDGCRPVYGEKEGRFITSYLSHKYNDSYLNSILFWISQFAENKDTIDLARGTIRISARPVECSVEVGILSDRPASEPLTEESED